MSLQTRRWSDAAPRCAQRSRSARGGRAAVHRPRQALQESAATNDKAGLLRLLLPVTRAAEKSALIKSLVDTQAVFRAQAWTAREAHAFLRDVPALESSGVVISQASFEPRSLAAPISRRGVLLSVGCVKWHARRPSGRLDCAP